MPLIPLRPLLETVDKYHFAQGAFNVNAVAQAKQRLKFMRCSVPQRFFRVQTLQMDLWAEEQISRMLLWKIKKSVQKILQML